MKDDRLNKKYTLEEHLKSLANEDKDYELLCSIWDLNKRNLTQGLNLVSSSFPHYSIHDANHSMTIIDNIQSFLGEDRIKRLSATDTFLILMAGLTHDIGMILMYNIIEEEWLQNDFKVILEEFINSNDSVIADSAKLLMKIHQHKAEEDLKDFRWALQVKNAVIVLTAEIFRSKHANQSANYLSSNETFKQLANNFHAEQLPRRFMDLLANVASLHGENFEAVMLQLYQEANGYKGDYIHPRFIAYMIRLGDLLDFDNNRFNLYSRVVLKEVPETSKLHEQKHASVRHMLISPNSIEAELDCPNEEVYRVSRSWFDWLEKEVSSQSREWTNIAPLNLGGLPPVISKGSIKILYNGIQGNSNLLNLKFSMSQEKMFSILQGGGIYKEPGFAFIREIVQNAFDASKIQMWNDIENGFYDSYFTTIPKEDIKFPDDIAPIIYQQYPVTLKIKWKNENKNILHFECEDFGTGISETTLLRMTNKVGESHKNDLGYTDIYNKMPYFLRPTAAFGIGLQSIFFVTQKFEVETSFLGETSKRIIFRSAANNQYCSIVEENIKRKRGTTVKIDIPKERFDELFGNSFSWDILGTTDVFKGEGDDLYLAKIDNFVQKTFGCIVNISFYYEAENPERNLKKQIENKETDESTVSRNDHYKYYTNIQEGFLVFHILENKIGSSFQLWFNNSIKRDSHLYQQLLLRDVLVSNAKFHYYKTNYLGFEWNLYSQSTDKVVDLSRDNLTCNGRKWITNTLLNTLLPDFLNLINNSFINILEKNSENESLYYQYFNYCLTSLACNLDIYDIKYLNKCKIPNYIASYNKADITADKLFETSILYLISGFRTNGLSIILKEDKNEIEIQCEELLKDKLVIWGENYLHNALKFNFICTEVIKYSPKCHIYKLEKCSNKNEVRVIKSTKEYLLSLESITVHKCSRNAIYGLNKYPNIVVLLNYISGFERFPDYGTCCIYSPFSEKEQANKLFEELKDKEENNAKEYIRKNINKYITPYMIEMIKKHNINKDITEEQIVNEYISLIYDFISIKKDFIKQKL